ncbi:Imm49 family immunity protein [Pyxidicoccus sp. 3LG]
MTMPSEFLPVFVQNALTDNEELLPELLEGEGTWESVLTFCQNLRIAGIGLLFLAGTSERFLTCLHHSGRAFAHFLEGMEDGAKLTSQCMPFFDAVAAGDDEGATQVARHSRRTWVQGSEYEEDFLFVEFLMQHFFLGTSQQEDTALLKRYEAALQGSDDCRLALCGALLEGDARAFEDSLERFLAERRDDMEDAEESGRLAAEVLATEGHLSVEGLALVRLAARKRIATREDYLHVPSVARRPISQQPAPEAWRSVQR